MRGADEQQTRLFSFTQTADRVPATHPLREVLASSAPVLEALQHRLDQAYAKSSRAAVPAEQVLRALLLWSLYGIPSEMRLLEELDYNLLYRWFVGLGMDDPIWARSTFRDNKERLIAAGVAGEFLARSLAGLPRKVLFHPFFSLNQSLIEAWGGQLDLEW